MHGAGAITIRSFEETMHAPALRFIESWSGDDAYDRFGSAGTGGQASLAAQLTQRRRRALIAISEHRVVGLLDHVDASGETHIGIVVDSRFRRLAIGTALIAILLHSPQVRRPIFAECGQGNRAAFALLRRCRFEPTGGDRYHITWRYA